jgi:PKD repeat protein
MIKNWTIKLAMGTVLVASSACGFEARSDDFACTAQLDCVDGRECRDGWCVIPGAEDDAGRIDARIEIPDAAPDAEPPFESAPRAIVNLSPAAGIVSTTFTADATSSVDREDATNTLVFTWDWDGDGSFEESGATSNHSYATPGIHTLVLRAEDPGGLVGFKAFEIIVAVDADLVTVTTTADENDTGATPSVPLNTGFSLREAIN